MFKARSSKKLAIVFKVRSLYKYAEFELLNGHEPKSINVKWTRHGQTAESVKEGVTYIWQKGNQTETGQTLWRLDFPDKPESILQLTLYKNKKNINYEHANCKYAVETLNEGAWKVLATADIDIAEQINTNTLTTKIKIEMDAKQKYVKKASLYLDLHCELIQTVETQKEATISKPKNLNQIIEILKLSNDDVITIGASYQPILAEILKTEVFLVVNQLNEVPSEFWKVLRRFSSKTKAHKQELQVIYVSLAQNSEELAQTVREEKLEFPVLKGSEELKGVLEQYIGTGDHINLLILSQGGDVIDNILGLDLIREYLEKRLTLNTFTDSVSISGISMMSRRTLQRDLNAEKILEKDHMIDILEEEKDYLKSENDQLRATLSDIQSAVEKNASIQKEHLDTEENLEYKAKILQAERDVRATLNKRGVSGVTGKKLRTRCFSFERDMVCYYDPITNKIKGQIHVTDILSMEKAPASKQEKSGVIFFVTTPSRVFEIQAMNDLQMENWISAVNVLKGVVVDRRKRYDTL